MTDLAARLAALTPARRALLERMQAAAASPLPRIPEGPAPLSAEQRRLWYLLQLAGDQPIYGIPLGFRLRGALDVTALRRALRELVARHEALRTAFRESAGEPVQEVAPEGGFDLEVLDLRGDAWAEPEANYQTGAFVRRRFRLEAGETFRALLIRERDDEYRLLLGLHHLAGDGASVAVLLGELATLYAAARGGEVAALPLPAVRFRDWAAWQGRRGVDPADEAYWRAELIGARTLLDLPTDHRRPEAQAWEGARHAWEIAPETAAGVMALARRAGTTPYVVSAAAVGLLLARYSGEDDLLLGTVLANRPLPQLQNVVGFFANTVPLRVRLHGTPTVAELLRRVHAAAAGSQAHGAIPFDRLLDLAEVRRDFRRPPLVQVVLGFTVATLLALDGVDTEPLRLESGTSIFELTVLLEQDGDRLRATLQYSDALWDRPSIVRMGGHLERILAAFATGEDRPLAEISLAASDEVEMLERWCRGDPPGGTAACLHEVFRRQARATPGATAVAWSGGSVTYAELDRRSDRAAAALRARGVGLETRVAVRMARTPDLVAAVLAVLKAGGAYVPLDPAHPPARQEAVVRLAGASLVVGEAPGSLGGVPVVPFAALDADPAGVEGDAPHPGALAYVLFTSGSTGGPKGVEIEHRAASAVVAWMEGVLSPEERAVVLGSTPITFDVSVGEIFGTLSCGGTLVLTENALAPLPDGWPAHAAAMTPTAAAELLELGRFPEAVRTVLLGGEPVPRRLVDALHALPGVRRVLNLYGPTEDAVYSTCAELEAQCGGVTLGRPISGGIVRVLDAALRPAGVGVPGEGWTAGLGVARGYAGRPALTAERFLPDPWGTPGSRMYRTLDRLRWLPDGTLDYLGRVDAQVKVRGHRIELGEVEETLGGHPAVAAAAAAPRGEGAAQQLAAYLVPRKGTPRPEPAELRAWLRERLPEYMVPGQWTWLDALPRTSSGKVDRRALPDPAGAGGERIVEPRNEVERRLAAIWAAVLGVERVGATDDFFDLGGQSILATRLVARVRTELGADLPVAELLQAPTVEAMARALEVRSRRVRLPLVPLQTLGDRPPLFLAHPAGGHVVCYRGLAVLLAPEQPVYGLQPRGVEDGLPPLDDLREMAAHYLEALRTVQPGGPYRLGGWSFGGVVAWEMARQLLQAGEAVELLALLDTSPLDGGGLYVDPRDVADVVWNTVAGLAGFAAASRVDVEALRGLAVREAALAMVRGIDAPRLLPESRVDDVVALAEVRGANLRAQQAYRPEPLPVRLTYFRTAGSALTQGHAPGLEFWSALALGGTTLHGVSGSHGVILNEPHVALVADAIRALGR